jgi:hypothetical protein
MIKIYSISLFFLCAKLSVGYCLNNPNNTYLFNDTLKVRFNYKTGKKENGIYFHYGKKTDFKHHKNSIKNGFYVITDCLMNFEIINQEVIRYFNFGFPEADFILQSTHHFYFLTVYFTESKEDAMNKVIETKSAGVPHVWVQVLEE